MRLSRKNKEANQITREVTTPCPRFVFQLSDFVLFAFFVANRTAELRFSAWSVGGRSESPASRLLQKCKDGAGMVNGLWLDQMLRSSGDLYYPLLAHKTPTVARRC